MVRGLETERFGFGRVVIGLRDQAQVGGAVDMSGARIDAVGPHQPLADARWAALLVNVRFVFVANGAGNKLLSGPRCGVD